MKDRKYSDTSDAFLCDILSKKCNQFLSTFNTYKTRNITQVNQTLKLTSNQIKTSKTIITRNKIIYSNTITQSTIRQITQEQTSQLRKKEQELLEQLMKHIIINIKIQFEDILTGEVNMKTDKTAFQCILQAMEQEYCLINQELSRVKKYIKKKQIRDVINFEINSIAADQFIDIIFSSLPNLKQFFKQFQIDVFANQQIQILRDQSDLIYELVDLDELIEKRIKEKKLKKKNKKKKNKQKCDASQSTCEGFQMCDKHNIDNKYMEKQNNIVKFLQTLVIEPNRTSCSISDDWIKKLTLKYVQ